MTWRFVTKVLCCGWVDKHFSKLFQTSKVLIFCILLINHPDSDYLLGKSACCCKLFHDIETLQSGLINVSCHPPERGWDPPDPPERGLPCNDSNSFLYKMFILIFRWIQMCTKGWSLNSNRNSIPVKKSCSRQHLNVYFYEKEKV